jgi:Rrf2 family protein
MSVSTSSRLAVATHVLAAVALGDGAVVSSDALARSVNTNPAFVRRLLSLLAKAGLTTSQLGQGGGALLARPPAKITLLDVYRAVEEPPLFALHHGGPSRACPIGKNILPVLEEEISAATKALERSLSKTTIADVAHRIAARAGSAAIERILGLHTQGEKS